ncbi:MAG TPA: hypothetical protein VFY83_13665 [Anaerolineales bacterium]|jgi:hypothetical protein|nr:hypothetical protein [Anaerolineales bacterium]
MAYIQRTGQDTILRSNQLPAIAIQIAPAFKYVGSTSFILYDVARAEQHHFVIADAERRVLRRLWFQFEGFLENNNRTYNYSGMDTLTLNGFTFLHNTYPMNIEEVYAARPTSDSAHAVDFLKEKGYLLTGDIMSHRMVWLDEERRNELMIIYSEDLNPTGFQADELTEGGSQADKWSSISEALHQRALASFSVP